MDSDITSKKHGRLILVFWFFTCMFITEKESKTV